MCMYCVDSRIARPCVLDVSASPLEARTCAFLSLRAVHFLFFKNYKKKNFFSIYSFFLLGFLDIYFLGGNLLQKGL